MKIYALIPARGGSKRIPKKNLQEIGGKSLVQWSISAAMCVCASSIDGVFVSSDDQDILKQAAEIDGCRGVMRKSFACQDDSTDRDVVVDFLNWLKLDSPDLIVYLRPTTPFRRIVDIEQAIQKMIDIPDATGLRSVHEMSESAYKCFEVFHDIKLKRLYKSEKYVEFKLGVLSDGVDGANLPNHCYPQTYHPNGVVDIIRPHVLTGNPGVLFGDEVMAHITEPTIEIDTPFDLQMAHLYHMYRQPDEYEVFK